MLNKILLIVLFSFVPVHALIFACINQSGFDVGAGNNTVDVVAKGNICYLSMNNNYKAFAATIGLNLERKFLAYSQFKLYGMCGAFIEYYSASSAYIASLPNNVGQRAIAGFDIVALRPEVIMTPKISMYANITLVKYEFGTEIGNDVWILGIPSSSALGINNAVPQFGLKFYF